MVYNPLSCSGWEDAVGFFTFGECMQARLGIVFLFFIIAIIRKWGGEEMGLEFNFLFALILSILPYGIIIFLFGSVKIAMATGIVGGLIGGYASGLIFGGGSE